MSQEPTTARGEISVRQIAVATAVALLAAAATFVLLGGGDDDAAGSKTTVDPSTYGTLDLAPTGEAPDSLDDVVVVRADRSEVKLVDVLGDGPTVVNFFASTCPPCIKEMPAIERVHDDLGDEVTFIGLAVNDRPEKVAELVERTGVTYETYRDPDASAFLYFESIQMPTTVFLDAEGGVAVSHAGEFTEAELREAIDDAFGIS